ncbi:MsnO8 family LLM class oxidoreductase [Mycobacterium sp. OTB74]|uniref:MsnO8 family LLM class oxidoreductase n=1 Tax=Mycobacterium sp. OTB74 TaxID=1853452 RepID=UPI0024735067|nr:MsnO8 family LLM class oxidoreductase [Mycobacterium sp. OTB74]MDH6246093.1 luciferase family oxidoreductase group 1 [Mycobacterium sp. OTB74]
MKIGVLDFGREFEGLNAKERLEHTVELARLAEKYDFSRYWLGEHHGADTALAAPEIILTLLAAKTDRIKIGPGGLLLRYYSPFKVAELYLTLSAAFPGRLDLGLCRGPGVLDQNVAFALVGGNNEELTDESYDAKVDDLVYLLDPQANRPDWLTPRPRGVMPPPIWILGSGSRSARQAIRMSARYGFMCIFPGSDEFGPGLVEQYRTEVKPVPMEGPLIAVSVICGETSEDAQAIDRSVVGGRPFKNNVVGDCDSCVEKIEKIASCYGVNEVLVATFSKKFEDHARMIASLGRALRSR